MSTMLKAARSALNIYEYIQLQNPELYIPCHGVYYMLFIQLEGCKRFTV
jgi:hypothetical protein